MRTRFHGLLAGLAVAAANAVVPQEAVPAALVGTWRGDARIANARLAPCAPEVRITIAGDGTVQGMVGEARLVDGRLTRNRSALGRAMRVKTDWIVDARLDGPLLSAESVTRERVRIPFDVEGDSLQGGFHAMGGGDRVSAVVVLRRP